MYILAHRGVAFRSGESEVNMYALTNYERETVINFNNDEPTATFYTCNKAWIRKMDALCSKTTEIIVKKQDEFSKTYIIPKTWIKVRIPRQLSEEKRKELAERARANLGRD